MRLVLVAFLWTLPQTARAWDTAPHQLIARAALRSLPARAVARFAAESTPLAEIYCMYPDRFLEMERFGFVRKSAGPQSAAEIREYCMRPTGELVHGVTLDREPDLAALRFLYERIRASLAARRAADAAKYAGVLAHFVADSLSPPHSVTAAELQKMLPFYTSCEHVQLHPVIEKSLPEFTLGDRAPQAASAEAVLDRLYAGSEANRKVLPALVRAACSGDQAMLDVFRLRAGKDAAGILADALFTAAR